MWGFLEPPEGQASQASHTPKSENQSVFENCMKSLKMCTPLWPIPMLFILPAPGWWLQKSYVCMDSKPQKCSLLH